jgi:hypothetical protein
LRCSNQRAFSTPSVAQLATPSSRRDDRPSTRGDSDARGGQIETGRVGCEEIGRSIGVVEKAQHSRDSEPLRAKRYVAPESAMSSPQILSTYRNPQPSSDERGTRNTPPIEQASDGDSTISAPKVTNTVTQLSPPGIAEAVGVDLGATDLWVVGLDGEELPHVAFAKHLRGEMFKDFGELLRGTSTVAIDAPEGLSAGSHYGDQRLARKFQRARCSEVALRQRGIAVPFATPMEGELLPAWMATGFRAWRAAKDVAPTVVETYPHGIFWRLAGRPLTGKQRDEGRAARRAVLASLVRLPPGIDFWPHDALDALACALLARSVALGEADEISCADDLSWGAHDGSSMWLPLQQHANPVAD